MAKLTIELPDDLVTKLKRLPLSAEEYCRRALQDMVSDEDSKLITMATVAERIGVPLKTLYNWRSAGTGPPGRRLGKHVMFRPRDVDDWFASRPR